MRGLVACVVIACAWSAHGAEILKYRLPDGGLLYTDQPQERGHVEEIIETPPSPAAAGPEQTVERGMPVPDAAAAHSAALDAAGAELRAARQQLADAERALDAGREPLPGERLGNVNGTTRLGPEYWQRIGALRTDVERARERVAAAQTQLDAVR